MASPRVVRGQRMKTVSEENFRMLRIHVEPVGGEGTVTCSNEVPEKAIEKLCVERIVEKVNGLIVWENEV